jgi:hypothetical protein
MRIGSGPRALVITLHSHRVLNFEADEMKVLKVTVTGGC